MTDIIVGAILVLATFTIIKGVWEEKKNYKKDKEAWEKVNPEKDYRFRSGTVPIGYEKMKDGKWEPKLPNKLSFVQGAGGCLFFLLLLLFFYLVMRYIPGPLPGNERW